MSERDGMNPKRPIRVLIVDDEYYIRQRVKQLLSSMPTPPDVVGEAETGPEAWEMYSVHRPELLLLDINIPVRSGMDIARAIRESDDRTQIVFVTGYADFPLVKQSLTLDAADYVLKPISPEELYAAVERSAERLGKLASERDATERLERELHRYMLAANEQSVLDFVRQRRPIPECVEALRRMGIPCGENSVFRVMAVEIDEEGFLEHVTARDRQLYQYAYVKLARELLEGQEGAFAASESERRLLLIWCADRERVTDTYLQSFASRMQETYRKYLKRTVTIGIGEPAEGPEELYRGYRQALHALELRALLPPGSIVPYASVSPQALEREPDHPMVGKELFLLSEIRAGHGEHVRKALSELEPMLRSLPWGELRKAAYRIFLYIRRLSLETAQPDEPDDPFDPKDAAQATRAEELVRLVADYATFVCAKVEKIKEQPSYRMIAEAKAWIKERLDEEITLQRLSERFHIHPKYFSQRFKQATGETYMDYITRVRFDKAKELLVAGDLKVAGVAERVGFADANYFSIAFKKYTGYTPSEYRERHRA